MKTRYFGTDGIRGAVGGPVINEAFLRRMGYALARFLEEPLKERPQTVVVSRDTRASGLVFERAVCEGLHLAGVQIHRLGVVPTPVVSMAVRDLHAQLGIALTASHNPSTDNGLKLFGPDGLKLTSELEVAIERYVDQQPKRASVPTLTLSEPEVGYEPYLAFQKSLMPSNCLKGWRIALDTAHGAAYQTTPAVLRYFGAELIQIGCEPDGENINQNVGSEHPEGLATLVCEHQAHLGIAHDGDADRVLFCDEAGVVLPGEAILGALALDLIASDQLYQHTLVTTVQSNLGLDHALAAVGGKTLRTPVGDRHVARAMLEGGYGFGGEASGHYLFFEQSKSGDGLLAAIRVLELMLRTDQSLSQLNQGVRLFPQVTKDLYVAQKLALDTCPRLVAMITEVKRALEPRGRVLVRYSGTEPKLRLLVEAEAEASLESALMALVEAANEDLQILP